MSKSEFSSAQSSTDSSRSLLLIGKSKAGKTHYGGQLYSRLDQNVGRLKKCAAPQDIEAFEEVLKCLNKGVPASHTPTNAYKEISWPVRLDGYGEFDLVWPDYGGEQVRFMVEQRRVEVEWRQRLIYGQGWLLFVRLGGSRNPEDVLSRPARPISSKPTSGKNSPIKAVLQGSSAASDIDDASDQSPLLSGPDGSIERWSEQVFFIELLQMLLFVRGSVGTSKVKKPTLCLVLSCWDELDTKEGDLPLAILEKEMPLLSQFVVANWEEQSSFVYGLSALGKPLSKDLPDEGYINEGPDCFGYVVCPDGTQSSDLTLPISFLIEQILVHSSRSND